MEGLESVQLSVTATVKVMSPHPGGQVAVIAGAGPAGLTASLELLRRTDIMPIVFEADSQVGGISKTIEYRGNRMDLGGHRFFSKSDWVMRWWQEILPIEAATNQSLHRFRISYQGGSREVTPSATASTSSNSVMLIRPRLSRIYYRRKFFSYPLKLNASTLKNLGINEAFRIGVSYAKSRMTPKYPELTLEDFIINRFGGRLYSTFFKDYTEKVWGVPCARISAEWGVQRIKGLSVRKAITHALLIPFRNPTDSTSSQTEASLIEQFLYPKYGPGQMWEEVARQISHRGGQICLRHRVIGIEHKDSSVIAVSVLNEATGIARRVPCRHFVSTMPIRDLVAQLTPGECPVARIADELPYRDFMTAGMLVRRMKNSSSSGSDAANGMPPDNWIYIQEPDVKIGRLQIFNNWSSGLVADPSTIWLGLEYFCQQGDELWTMSDKSFLDFAAAELEKIGLIDHDDVIGGTVVRVPKAYPAYFGAYAEFHKIRTYLDQFSNLYPIGRNGMHRYNNQDHSMLAAKGAVDSIIDGSGKSDIWLVNSDNEYHERAEEPS
jgi:protoporphyrinogen oxidase